MVVYGKKVCTLIIKYHNSKISKNKKSYNKKILGKSIVNWTKHALLTLNPKTVLLNKQNTLNSVLQKYVNNFDYIAVFYYDTPLITIKNATDSIDYAVLKELDVCNLPKGFVFKTEFLIKQQQELEKQQPKQKEHKLKPQANNESEEREQAQENNMQTKIKQTQQNNMQAKGKQHKNIIEQNMQYDKQLNMQPNTKHKTKPSAPQPNIQPSTKQSNLLNMPQSSIHASMQSNTPFNTQQPSIKTNAQINNPFNIQPNTQPSTQPNIQPNTQPNTQSFMHYEHEFLQAYDLNNLSKIKTAILQKIINMHKQNGVVFAGEQNVIIDYNCKIGGGTIVYPNNYILSGSVIEKNCVLMTGNIITNSKILKSLTLTYCVITNSSVEKSITPFSVVENNVVVK